MTSLVMKAEAEASERVPAQGPLAGARMLFVAPDDYPAFRVDLVELFSNHLVGRGLKIDWSLRPFQDGPARVDERGAERFHVARRQMSGKFGALRYRMAENWLRLKLAWRAARGDYDLIQIRDQPLWAITYALAGRISGTPCLFWMSYPVLEGRLRDALKNLVPMSWPSRLVRIVYATVADFLFYKVALPLSSHVIVQSKRMRERVGFRGIAMQKMTPIPMGVSTERYNIASIRAADDPRLAGKKSMAYLCANVVSILTNLTVDALAELVAEGHDAVLVLIGAVSDFERKRLDDRLEELGVSDRVIFTGRLPLAEALGWVKRADVCLSPFMMDAAQQVATPTKLVEYLAMGRPVVGTVHYDQNEVIHGSGTGFVTAFSGKAMAEGVARLFADPQKAEAMGARGPAWVKANRDYTHLADVVEQIYMDLLDRQRASMRMQQPKPGAGNAGS
ncbi:glycosyltransferase [Aquamicrobium terrae]|uniref:Glycosyltransferase involved in cell wall biosynthesis n=1 Tax=Aquamicrobium terrae TaxID=1324945 RepID=A0ABV2N0T6_9HYPH